jgi:phosphohistidine phosphatase
MQKKIYIVRHAKSSWTNIGLSDFDRPLDDRGERDAPVMAAFLKRQGVLPDVIISSPAKRAKTTAMVFSDVFHKKVTFADNLYHGDPEDYLQHIQLLDENVQSVMLFGHNPGITYIAHLVKPHSTENVSTCGVLDLSMDAGQIWETADWSAMTLEDIYTPKSIR